MENKNIAPAGGGQNGRRSLFDQPRKAVSGLVYSGAIIGMLFISLAFSVTLAIISASLGISVDELSKTEAYRYCSYLLYQVVYVGVIFAFAKIYKVRPSGFGYRRTKARYFMIAPVLAFGLLFSLSWLNGWFVQLLELLGYNAPESSLPSVAGAGFFGVLLVVAVFPAFCEETIFRGIILDGVKDIGTVAACLLGGLLFSIFHQNPPQTLYQFICGAVFTLLAIRADSIWPAVLVHFLNNAVIVFDYKFGFLDALSAGGQIAVYVVSAVCLAASLAYLIFFDKKTNRRKEGEIKPFFYPALAGVILCAVLWFANLANGFMG